MKLHSLLIAAAALASLALPVMAQEKPVDPQTIWGGGAAGASVYTDVYVPHLVATLEQNRLAGYHSGGISKGTLYNAQMVSDNQTNLAVGQLDLLRGLNGQPRPDGKGNFAFTILAENIGPECLYLVTPLPGYNTFGDFLGNAWQATIATGPELSGSLGTLQHLAVLYPTINEAIVTPVGSAKAIVEALTSDQGFTHGFFVMRPDPQSETFKLIADAKLNIVPIVDFGLEGEYEFLDLKVQNGGIFSAAKTMTTACTSVALITGDPASAQGQALPPRLQKRLQATISTVAAIPPATLKPSISSWADMWDSIKSVTGDKAKELMEASKTALEDVLEQAR